MKARSENEGNDQQFLKILRETNRYIRGVFDDETDRFSSVGNADFEKGVSVVHDDGRQHVENLSFSGYEENPFFHNTGKGQFVEIGGAMGVGVPYDGRGLATADLDRDGDPDIVLRNAFRPTLMVLRNEIGSAQNSITVRLRGTKTNHFGIGARVVLESGGKKQAQEMTCGDSYLSCGPPELHFGLGKARTAEKITVHWPSGTTTSYPDLPAGLVTITEGKDAFESKPYARPDDPTEKPVARPLRKGDVVTLKLTDLEGMTVDSFRDRWTVLSIWSLSCRSCASERQSYPEILEVAKNHEVDFYSVNIDEDIDSLRKISADSKWTEQTWIGHDVRDLLLNPHEPIVPTMIVVGPEGRVVARHVGAFTSAQFDVFLRRTIKK